MDGRFWAFLYQWHMFMVAIRMFHLQETHFLNVASIVKPSLQCTIALSVLRPNAIESPHGWLHVI